jgi:hypothetical protein
MKLISQRIFNHLSGPSQPRQVEHSDSGAFGSHADNQDDVDEGDDGQEDIPEPEEGEDLLRDDVWRQHAKVLFAGHVTSGTEGEKFAFGHSRERFVEDHRAVHLRIENSFEPIVALKKSK